MSLSKELHLVLKTTAENLTEKIDFPALTPAEASEFVVAYLPENPTLKDIESIEKQLATYEQIPLRAIHMFSDGVVTRSLWRPAGTVIVGKLHRKSHLFMVVSGTVTVLGHGGFERVTGPHIMATPAGIKRITVAHTDAVIMTIHPNPNNWGESDMERLEEELVIAPDSVV